MKLMKQDWIRVGTNVAVGGSVGVVDQLLQNEDVKRKAAEPDMSMFKEYGTYYNYGLPILTVFATALGWIKGEWANRAVVAGSQLAGRKATMRFTGNESVPFASWTRQRQVEAAKKAALERARKQVGGEFSPPGIPVIADAAILV